MKQATVILATLVIGVALGMVAIPVLNAQQAQTVADDLTADQLKNVVSGKTWAIAFGGDPANTSAHWDFKADGSVCGRLPGSKLGKCADIGKWKLQGDTLCWQFEWMGEGYGYKSLCVRVRKAAGKTYQAIDQNGKLPPVPFYPVN